MEYDHRVIKQLHNMLKLSRNLGVSLLVAIMFFVLGPIIEGQYFPVMTDVTGTYVSTSDNRMFFNMYANKIRSCTFIDIRALVDKDITDTKPPVKGAIWFASEDTGSRIRPKGYQDLGIWAVRPDGDRVIVEASWSCHPFWNTSQSLGVWDKPK